MKIYPRHFIKELESKMPRTCSKCGRSGHNRRSCMEKVKDLTPTHGTVYTYLVDENNKKPEYMNLRECSGTDVAKKKAVSHEEQLIVMFVPCVMSP